MKLNLDTIILFVRNVDRLKSFYVDILKLDIIEEIQSEWLLLKAGNCHIGLHKMGDAYGDIGNGSSGSENNTKIVFEVGDINKVREQ